MSYIYILLTVGFTVYSQLIMRWQVSLVGTLPGSLQGKAAFIFSLLTNGWVISGIVATFFAGVSWMMALSRFQLSYAYPFVSLTYILVLLGGVIFFRDAVNLPRIIGTVTVMAGIYIVARGG